MKFYLRGDYYFDIDKFNQLRIAGPENHLLLGLSFPPHVKITLGATEMHGEQLAIQLEVNAHDLELTLPLVTDIRTLRSYTEPVSPTPTYPSLVSKKIKELLPDSIERTSMYGREYIKCQNTYTDAQCIVQSFGAYIGVEPTSTIELSDMYIRIQGTAPLKIWVETCGTIRSQPLKSPLFRPSTDLPSYLFDSTIRDAYHQAEEEIAYLLRTRKTSGFEYGTIFPRDWIESADLGRYDLTHETVNFMYEESMKYISDKGEGWHEDMIGAYRAKVTDSSLHIDRKMIDIEPKYILGLRHLTANFVTRSDIQNKMKLVGRYVVENALNNDLITFKKVSPESDTYQFIGNWRDSYQAYPRQKSPLAPFDVNCVLYPQALILIRTYAQYFGVDVSTLDALITKWSGQKDKFRLYHPGQVIGYSLALQGSKNTPLPIAHTDEAYDLFYGSPSREEVISFAKKCLSSDYFYTPVGPLLVASDEEDFSTHNYHGKVIWPKQSAYCVAGLTKQYTRATNEQWPAPLVTKIREAALTTAQASFRAFAELNSLPELYYYDAGADRARLYTDQDTYEGQMSIVQLWSSIGARRMIRDYAFLHGHTLRSEVV